MLIVDSHAPWRLTGNGSPRGPVSKGGDREPLLLQPVANPSSIGSLSLSISWLHYFPLLVVSKFSSDFSFMLGHRAL